MTVEAPRHVQRLHLFYLDHLVNPAVADNATYAGSHVRLMIEIDIVRQTVDLHPGNGITGGVAFPDTRQTRTLRLHPRVTIHASFRRGYGCEGSFIHRIVTVVTIHSEVARMQFMAVGNGLLGGVARLEYAGHRNVDPERDTRQGEKADGNGSEPHISIGGFWEN